MTKLCDWSEQPLGEVTDAELAERLGLKRKQVAQARRDRGVPVLLAGPDTRKKGIDWDSQPLGAVPDPVLAERLGVKHCTVWQARKRRGIPRCVPVDWDKIELGQRTDADIARKYGLSASSVSKARAQRGIPRYLKPRPEKKPRTPPPVAWDEQPLGIVSDKELAARLGVTRTAVRCARVRRGIAPVPPDRRAS